MEGLGRILCLGSKQRPFVTELLSVSLVEGIPGALGTNLDFHVLGDELARDDKEVVLSSTGLDVHENVDMTPGGDGLRLLANQPEAHCLTVGLHLHRECVGAHFVRDKEIGARRASGSGGDDEPSRREFSGNEVHAAHSGLLLFGHASAWV